MRMRGNAQTHHIIGYLAQTIFLLVLAGVGGWGIMIAIPSLYSEGGWTTFVQVCGWIIAIEMFVNWLCTKLVSSKYDPAHYGYNTYLKGVDQNGFTHESNGLHNLCPESETLVRHGAPVTTDQSEWTMCRVCEHTRPFRTHHCSVCNVCILKRDHHCYFVGSCIGYRNLRHFVVFLFWTTIGTIFATCHMFPYYYYTVATELDITAIHPFVCLKRVVAGQLSFKYFILTSLGWALLAYTFVSLYFFKKYVKLILCGRTYHEQRYCIKTVDVRNTKEKLRTVFGQNWAFNFLFPLYFMYTSLEDPFGRQSVKYLEI